MLSNSLRSQFPRLHRRRQRKPKIRIIRFSLSRKIRFVWYILRYQGVDDATIERLVKEEFADRV